MTFRPQLAIRFTKGGKKFTLAEGATHVDTFHDIRKPAFTLAEVLVTLGIIGVVAAMTLPSIITSFQKKAVAAKLKKFYSTMNQVVNRATVDYGDVRYWLPERKYATYEEALFYLQTYIFPYLSYLYYVKAIDTNGSEHVAVYLPSGGMFIFYIDINGADIIYYIDGNPYNRTVKNRFAFQFNKVNGFNIETNQQIIRHQYTTFIEPYTYGWTGEYEDLKNNHRGCRMGNSNCLFCTKLIQMNDWEISDDYPW